MPSATIIKARHGRAVVPAIHDHGFAKVSFFAFSRRTAVRIMKEQRSWMAGTTARP